MKAITNWRYYVMAVLFNVGFISLFVVTKDESDWFLFFMSKGFAGALFYTLFRCVKRWEARGEIPEFTNQFKDDE